MAKEQVIIGVAAGSTPVLVNLVNVDASLIFAQWDWAVFSGYLIKALVLMLLGGLVVYVNGELQNWKAFQLGIMAPALVVGFLNGQKVDVLARDLAAATQGPITPRDKPAPMDSMKGAANTTLQPRDSSFGLISAAHADDPLLKGLHRDVSNSDKVFYGFTGYSTNNWFVIVGSFVQEQNAYSQAANLKKLGYDARVYERFSDSKFYAVAIGANVSLNEAKRLRDQALRDGLPSDTYLWKLQP